MTQRKADLRARLRAFHRDEDGQMMVITLLSMALLLGFLALAVDVGLLFRARRVAQTAADTAAIAGALELAYNGSTNVASVAQTAAGNNGISNVTTNVNVHVSPNITSPYHNAVGYVEVVVHQPAQTLFMNVFKTYSSNGASSMGSVNVTAKAIAGITPSPNCDIQLDRNADDNALWIKGNTTITTPNCGIQVNSSSTGAFCDQGNAKVNGPYIHVTGNQSSGGKCGKSPGAPVYSNIPPVADPFAGLPDASKQCVAGNTVPGTSVTGSSALPSTTVTVPSGQSYAGTTYQLTCFSGKNVSITGTFGNSVDNGQVFVFTNGMSLSGTVTVNGTLDVAAGTFDQKNATLNVNAPGSNNNKADKLLTFNSIALYQPSTNTTGGCLDGSVKKAILSGEQCLQVQFGSGSGNLSGFIYAPNSMVYLQDQGGGVQAAGVVSYTMFVNSQLTFTNSYNNANPSSTPLTTIELVE